MCCNQKKLTVRMDRRTNKTLKKKPPPASSRSGATTRARSAASGQPLPVTNTSPTGTASRKRGNQTTNKSTAAKRSRLTKKDIPKIVKIVMDAFGESDTDSDDGVEIPTVDEAEEELVSQEQRNSRIGREYCMLHALHALITKYSTDTPLPNTILYGTTMLYLTCLPPLLNTYL